MLDYSWEIIEKECIGYKYDNLNLEGKELVLFGLGMQGTYAIEYFKNKCEVIYLTDNNSALWGQKINDILVIPPSKIKELTTPYVMVTTATRNYDSIFKQLDALKIEYVSLFKYLLIKNIKKFKNIYEAFCYDEESRKVWLTLIYGKLKGKVDIMGEAYSPNQYYALPAFVKISNENIMIDCGAYVGDSLEKFIYQHVGIFKKIYAFEPGRRQFKAMEIRCQRLIDEWALRENQIVLENVGIGGNELKQIDMKFIDATISTEVDINSQNEIVKLISLDDYFENLNEKICFIKADIEGFEIELLRGAERIIKKYKPNIAICVYHRPMDLIDIPLYLTTLVPEYKMSLRHHSVTDEETVLYCYL